MIPSCKNIQKRKINPKVNFTILIEIMWDNTGWVWSWQLSEESMLPSIKSQIILTLSQLQLGSIWLAKQTSGCMIFSQLALTDAHCFCPYEDHVSLFIAFCAHATHQGFKLQSSFQISNSEFHRFIKIFNISAFIISNWHTIF